MKARARLITAWASAGVVVLGCVGAWSAAVPAARSEGVAPRAPVPPMQPIAVRDAEKSASALRQHDPFRIDRRPSDVRYNPWAPVGAAVAPPARPPRPPLAIGGIVGGPPWNALVLGLPGREGGALLTVGDTAAGIRVLRITRDTVYLAGLDTTWALTQRRSWR